MRMFHFSIEGITDENKNGIPDVHVRAEVVGFKIYDGPIDVSAQEVFGHLVDLARKLKILT